MTTLRETVEQALEALELGYDSAKSEADQYHAAMAGFRPERHAQMDADVQQIAAAIAALRAALAQQAEPVQEPVAWRTFDGEGGYDYRTYEDNEDYAAEWAQRNPRHVGWVEPLYLTPPQRKPLTDEEIAAEWQKASECASKSEGAVTTSQFVQMFARAIERAHGIKE